MHTFNQVNTAWHRASCWTEAWCSRRRSTDVLAGLPCADDGRAACCSCCHPLLPVLQLPFDAIARVLASSVLTTEDVRALRACSRQLLAVSKLAQVIEPCIDHTTRADVQGQLQAAAAALLDVCLRSSCIASVPLALGLGGMSQLWSLQVWPHPRAGRRRCASPAAPAQAHRAVAGWRVERGQARRGCVLCQPGPRRHAAHRPAGAAPRARQPAQQRHRGAQRAAQAGAPQPAWRAGAAR